ncbi:alpha/beta hydrolase [Limnobacter humi]|uniref:Alpha/beta hydrolase n=1 Tax=Limnobacter humi TaxID=1778671 RepID=A0ABT1WGS0_9BURK|nr:alpha/beta hydrolase [Limnobacter humi]MCQ8896078.1 alpha/beta hydrolase [Limnobacter humi]
MNRPLHSVRVETGPAPKQCVIWLHGLGADGYDFVPIVKELEQLGLPATRFIFPHAPEIPVSINGGYMMRAWYDIRNVDLQRQEDEQGVRQSQGWVDELIAEQCAAGLSSERIVLAGFSQGGAIAYQTGLRSEVALGGIVALSTYLPCEQTLDVERNPANQSTPVFAAHGEHDDVVVIERGQRAAQLLTDRGYNVTWQTYPMAHSVCGDEIVAIARFLEPIFTHA